MKKCPQCEQVYGDETNFCLSDGATLVPATGAFPTEPETPTVVRQTPAPTVYHAAPPPTNFGNAPFVPPPASAPPERKSNTLLIALVVGFFALLVGGALVGAVIYGISQTDDKNTNVAGKTSPSPSPEQKSVETDERAEKLKKEQEKLDRDRQKLEEERKRLETQKKQSQQPPPPPRSGTTAVIIDPPSNIRATPNGTILCVARTRGIVVNITGETGVSDNNGTWYYTDYCGRQGVIHSTQIRF